MNQYEDTKELAETRVLESQEELEVERKRANEAEAQSRFGMSKLEELQLEYKTLERHLAEEVAKAEARLQVERQMSMRMEDKVAGEHRRVAQMEDQLMEERRKMQRQLAEEIARMEAKLHVERQLAMRAEDKIATETLKNRIAQERNASSAFRQRELADTTDANGVASEGQPTISSTGSAGSPALLESNCTKVSDVGGRGGLIPPYQYDAKSKVLGKKDESLSLHAEMKAAAAS